MNTTCSTPQALLTVHDVMARLQVCRRTAYRIMRRNGAIRVGQKMLRLPADRLVGVTITTQQVGA